MSDLLEPTVPTSSQLLLDGRGTPLPTPRLPDLVLGAEADLEAVAADVANATVIEVQFATLKDGRGYSHARSLREDHGFAGELRATGDVGVDQLHYLLRSGFSSFLLRPGTDEAAAKRALERFSHFYVGVVTRTHESYLS